MNRRGFLKFSAAAVAIAAAPVRAAPWTPNVLRPSVDDVLTLDKLREVRRAAINEHFEDCYYLFLSASQFAWLRTAEARQTWKHAHRTWRMSGKPGELEPATILAAHANDNLASSHLAMVEGFRFHVSDGPVPRSGTSLLNEYFSSGPSIRAASPCASRLHTAQAD